MEDIDIVKLKTLIESLKLEAKKNHRAFDKGFSVVDEVDRNVDDAFILGIDVGNIQAARFILDELGILY